jgi:UDP-N-acetylmuramoyl-tripeptide--D-alanyl-D-alanine ligase
MKRLFKSLVVAVLSQQVQRLYANAQFKTVGVVGSYGKTSTKLAIANTLATKYKTAYQYGNYNDLVSVPLVYFGLELPSLFNPIAWVKTFIAIERQLKKPYEYEVVVLELGIDGPNQMRLFEKYVRLDLAVVTAIGPEHMEYFHDVQQVSDEELEVRHFAEKVFVNTNLVHMDMLPDSEKLAGYSVTLPKASGEWSVTLGPDTQTFTNGKNKSTATIYSMASAAVTASALGFNHTEVIPAISKVSSMPGRMNVLEGIKNSTIIDDTYNASPEATLLALEALYSYPGKTKIALLGNMNELGTYSEKHHREVGRACDSSKLELVVTLGPDANRYLAEEAEKNGCTVIRTASAKEAGEQIKQVLKADAVVLAKGSQNGVFAEEAVKALLCNPDDENKLVRQSSSWLKKKQII